MLTVLYIVLINKANNVCLYFQTCDKLANYIKEVEICPGDLDAEMSNEEEKDIK
jgi:hypothetical protein